MTTAFGTSLRTYLFIFRFYGWLVEAAGVEPASENVTGQEPTCVVAFMPQALPWDVRGPRSERTRNASR